jgi:hypothetical protein
MGAHASAPQTCIKKGKASSLKKLIHQTQSSDKDEDIRAAAPSVSAKPWQADFMKYMDMVEAAPLSGMSTIQWWGVCSIHFLTVLYYLPFLCTRLMPRDMGWCGL